jgi:hypothetical protein
VVEHEKRGAHRVGCRHQSQARTETIPMVARVPSSVASMVLLRGSSPLKQSRVRDAGVADPHDAGGSSLEAPRGPSWPTAARRWSFAAMGPAHASAERELAPPPVNIAALTAVCGLRELGKDTCHAKGDTLRAATRCPETPARSTPLHCYWGTATMTYRESADRSESSGGGSGANARVIHQAIGVLKVRRETSIRDADTYLSVTAEAMGVDRAALSRLVIDAVNARGVGNS